MDYVIALFRLFVAFLAVQGTRDLWFSGDLDVLVYFTNQSGVLLAVVMVWGAVAQVTNVRQPPAWLKAGVVLFLLITGLVSFFILEPEAADAPALVLGLTSGTIEHELNPVLALLDFALFDAHRRLTLRTPLVWVGYLVAYATFSTIRGEILPEPHYPYGFLDVAELGWGGFAQNVAIYGVGFYVLGLLVVGLDRVLPARALLGSAGPEDDDGTRPAQPTGTPARAADHGVATAPAHDG